MRSEYFENGKQARECKHMNGRLMTPGESRQSQEDEKCRLNICRLSAPKSESPAGGWGGALSKIEQGGRLLRQDNAQGRVWFPGVARALEKIAS